MGPIVSVIATFFNCPEEVDVGLDVIRAQSYRNIRCVIVDDCSTDCTVEKIRDWLSRNRDDRFVLVVNEVNLGISAVRKRQSAAAEGKYIAFQEAGDWSSADRLAKQVAYLEKHADCAAVGCLFSNSVALNGTQYVRGARSENQVTFRNLIRQNRFAGGEVMIRKECIDAVGGFSDVLPYSEDYYLWLRLAKLYRLHVIQEVLYRREIQFKGLSFRPETFFQQCLCVIASRAMAAAADFHQAEDGVRRSGLDLYSGHPALTHLLARGTMRSALIGDRRGARAISDRISNRIVRGALRLLIPVVELVGGGVSPS